MGLMGIITPQGRHKSDRKRKRQIDPILNGAKGIDERVRIEKVLCEGRRRALEGWSQRWSFSRVAEGEDRQQRQQAERDEQADEERGKKCHPRRSVCAVAVWDEQRQERDGDGRDRYPKPSSLLAK